MSPWSTEAPAVEVPTEHRDAAEAIRQHLVSLRGGGVFLSSADGLRLLDWLDRSVPLADILRAIERAADSRRKTRSRIPLSLGHVSRHLGRPTKGVFKSRGGPALPPQPSGLEPLVALIRQRAADDPLRELLQELARDLGALPPGPQQAEQAMIRLGSFRQAVFDAMRADQREALLAAAREDLGDLVLLLEERDLGPLVEEGARSAALEGYTWLSAASVWDLVGEEAP